MPTTTSTTSSIVATLGAGSGINMTQLASDLAEAQFAARTANLTARSELYDRRISAASALKNGLSTLASSLGDRVRTGDLAAKPSVANSAVASASSPLGTFGNGTYSLEVTQLAKRQVLAGPTVTSAADVIGAGTLTIRFGTMGATFTADATKDPVDIEIPSGSTLTDVAAAINSSGEGLSAYVANTDDGPRLVIKGPEGLTNGFVIEATETVGEEGLAALAWEPVTGDPAALIDTSQNAEFELDGLPYVTASNTTGQLAPGLQLALTGTNIGTPTTITFGDASANVQTAMSDLVGALNEIATALRDATAPTTGDLNSDPGARALRQALSRLAGGTVMPNATGDAPRTLSDLGLKIDKDGQFSLDNARLSATMARDPEGVAAMFTVGLYGVYSTIDKLARDSASTGNPSSLGGSIARYERLAKEADEDVSELLEKQEALRVTMVARFAKADARVAASQSTLTFLQQQIDAWNRSDN
jgi:flagellar hook-associated protein 2